MAFDPKAYLGSEPQKEFDPKAYLKSEQSFDPKSYLDTKEEFNPKDYLESEKEFNPKVYLNEPEEAKPSLAKTAAGFLTEIAIGEVGRMAGGAAGAAIGSAAGGIGAVPGFLIGYTLSGLASGAAGSKIRQKMVDPNAEINQGQVVADALINLVPGFSVGKSAIKGIMAQGAIGAGISGSAAVAESVVNEKRLPTLEELGKAGLSGGILGGGLGTTAAIFSKSYQKFAGKPIDVFTAAYRANDPDARIIFDRTEMSVKEFDEALKKRYQEKGIEIREKYDDEFIRARLLQDMAAGGQLRNKDGKLKVKSDEMDYYMNRRLADATIDARVDELGEIIKKDSAFLLNKSDELGLDSSELSKKVNDYLHAKHAIAYNAAHKKKFKNDGAAGITTEKAQDIVNEFEGKKTYKPNDEVPNFRSDIPDENWLKGYQKDADLDRNRMGYPDLIKTTGSFQGGERTLKIPLSNTKNIKGYLGEEARLNKEKVDKLTKELQRDGKFQDPPLVGVAFNGTPYIVEGNHRIAASQKAGIPIDIEVRYFDGGERVAKQGFKPYQLASTISDPNSLAKQLDVVIESRRDLSKRILDTLKEGGLVDDKLYKKLRNDFPDYVPLNRIMESDDADAIRSAIIGSNSRYETKGRGVFKAVGSSRAAADINQNIVDNLAGAIRRAEVNKANQSFLNLVRANKKQSADIGIKEYTPKNKFDIPKDRTALTVFENGEKKYITFTDSKLADTFKGADKKQLPALLQATYTVNRTLGGLYTRYSPEFWIPNKFRDISEAIVNNANNMRLSDAIKVADPRRSMNVIQKKLRGIGSSSPEEQRLFDLYDQFKKDGGSTGGLGLSTIKDLEKQLNDLQEELRAPTRSKIKKFSKFINALNEVIEDSTRFDTYMAGLNSGMTSKQAAFAARNSSFDPRQRGKETDVLASLFLFANPAIQGGKNFIRSMSNKKVLGAVAGSLISTTYLLDTYNSSIDENYREKIPKWKLDKHITILRGKNEDGSLDYFSIPIGYSMVPFKMIADYTQKVALGGQEVDAIKDSTELASAFVNSYNPMGGSLVPTVLRPMTELSSNEDGLGRDIRPSWLENKNISATEQIFPWTADTQGGELALSLAEQLGDMGYEVSPENLLYLYQNYTGGPGQTVKRLFDLTSKLWNNERVSSNDIPMVRRFYGKTYTNTFEKRTGDRAIIENLEKQENTDSAKASRIAFKIIKRYDEAPEANKQIVLQDLLSQPEANAAVQRRVQNKLEDRAKGLTSVDRQAKNLTVVKRAEYFKNKIDSLTPEKIQPYISEMIEKRVLTPKVIETIKDTESFKEFFGQ